MKIEAVVVCVNYADFLAQTLPHNLAHFDRVVIVTTPRDRETINLCCMRNVICVQTEEFDREENGSFNKGRGIAIGLRHLAGDGWVCHMDGDIVLPSRFREMIDTAHLQKDCIYGIDRAMVRNWNQWKQLEASRWGIEQHACSVFCHWPKGLEPGTRVLAGRHGYVPPGFFQLWHGQHGSNWGVRLKDYSDANTDAAHSDLRFAMHWDRRKRILIPEIIALHLESEPCGMGANWKGRKTKPFGPCDSKPQQPCGYSRK